MNHEGKLDMHNLNLYLVLGLCVTLECVPAQNAGRAVVDCIATDRTRIDALIVSFAPLLVGEQPNWSSIEQQAIAAGETIGGCALAEVVQQFLAPPASAVLPTRAAPNAESGLAARAALEDFRTKHAAGATFHSRLGNL